MEQIFRKIYKDLENGNAVSPRGLNVLELENYTYELPAYARFANFEARKLNLPYIKKELLWYLRANPSDLSIQAEAKTWQGLENSDGTINSNYGSHLIGKVVGYANRIYQTLELTRTSQIDEVIAELVKDKDTRRASMAILGRQHVLRLSVIKDLPCTYALNFRIRNDELKMSVHMRSQDAIFGMGNDAPFFSMIQEMVYIAVRDLAYPNLKMGSYHHIADSFHVYERHYNMMNAINSGSKFENIEVPKIKSINEVKHLMSTIHLMYEAGKDYINYGELVQSIESMKVMNKLTGMADLKPASGEFSNWLIN